MLGLAAVCIAVYGGVAGFSFVNFDDDLYVYANPYTLGGLTAANFLHALRATDLYYWHPLALLSHMLDVELFGLNPGAHHAVNLLLHILNSILVYIVLRRMTGAVWRSAAGAALFAAHPLHVESVVWISERKDVLCGFFWLLTVLAYSWYAERPSPKRMLAVAAGFICALMSKPMAVTLPFALLLLDYWPLHRFDQARKWKKIAGLVLEKAPLMLLAAVDAVATAALQRAAGATILLAAIPLPLRIGNALVAYAAYLWRAIWPQNLSVLYIYRRDLPVWEPIAAGFLLAAVTAFVALGRRRYLVTGWLWFLGVLVPTIGLIQVGYQSSADRFVYLPLIGLLVMAVWGAAELAARWSVRRVAWASAAVLAVLAADGRVQAGYWRDGVSLFRHAVRHTRNNYVAHTLLGSALAERGQTAEAIPEFEQAVRTEPGYGLARNDLGAALGKQGRYQEALAQLDAAVRLMPYYGPAHYNRGEALMRLGRGPEALAEFDEALRREIPAQFRYSAHNDAGVILNNTGAFPLAAAHFEQALSVMPASAEARKNLASALFNQGRIDEAIAEMSQCLQLNPGDKDAAARLEAMQSRKPLK